MIIEEIVKRHFDAHLDAPSFFESEDSMPDEFVMIERVGGRASNKLPVARLAIQSYGTSLYNSAILNEKVKRVMDKLTNQPEISGVRLNSDYNFTDIETRRYRYQAVFEIYYYKGEI